MKEHQLRLIMRDLLLLCLTACSRINTLRISRMNKIAQPSQGLSIQSRSIWPLLSHSIFQYFIVAYLNNINLSWVLQIMSDCRYLGGVPTIESSPTPVVDGGAEETKSIYTERSEDGVWFLYYGYQETPRKKTGHSRSATRKTRQSKQSAGAIWIRHMYSTTILGILDDVKQCLTNAAAAPRIPLHLQPRLRNPCDIRVRTIHGKAIERIQIAPCYKS